MPKSDLTLISGEYAPVAARITLFYERYPAGRIISDLVDRTQSEILFKAAVYPSADDTQPAATGWALEREGDGDVNEVACLENTETSAIGRALANLGFTASSRRPSAEEMERVARARARREERVKQTRSLAHSSSTGPAPDAEPRQRRADSVSDVLALLRAAERRGLRPRRVEAIRHRLLAATTLPSQVDGIARVLRRWIGKQVHREVQSLLHPPRE